jgi:diaminopimelate epimerase
VAITLEKWHGLGNDYLVVERKALAAPLGAEQVRVLCDYHRGVGGDGILEVTATSGDEVEIVIWNPDGSTAELSGNGTRIAARRHALTAGLTAVTVRVGPRVVAARMLAGLDVETDVGEVSVAAPEALTLADGESVEVTPVSMGNPHAVIRADPGELRRLGPLVERHERFSDRTNVQLVRVDGTHDLTVAVWERGAGETLSSGTSSVAAAAAAVDRGWCESPVSVHLPGGDLRVELAAGRARLIGPAQRICTIELDPELGLFRR